MRLPPIFDDFIPPERVKQLLDLVNQPALVSSLKDAAKSLGWKESWQPQQLQDAMQQAKRWMESVADRFRSTPLELKNCINASGEIFSPHWCSIPADPTVLREQAIAHTGFTVGEAFSGKANLLQWTGAEDALVVGSLHQAIQLLGLHPAINEGWVLPRADCIRLPKLSSAEHSADIRRLLELSGKQIHEVGAVNECQLSDLESALTATRKAILSIDPSSISSPTPFQHLNDAILIAHRVHGLAAELLMTCSIHPIKGYQAKMNGHIPLLKDRVQADADIIILPGDGLLGGPRSAILLGKSKWLQPLHRLAEELGMTADVTTLVGLSAAIQTQQTASQWEQTPIGGMVNNGLENLQDRAQRLLLRIKNSPLIANASIETRDVPLGPQPWNHVQLPSAILQVWPKNGSAHEFQQQLASRDRPIFAMGQNLTNAIPLEPQTTNAVRPPVSLAIRTIDPNDDERVCDAFWPEESL